MIFYVGSIVQSFIKPIALIAIIGVAVFVSGCSKTTTQKIKVTVSVQDGTQIYSGSSVQKFTCSETINKAGMPSIGGCVIRGEAVPVKIGDKGYLFMLFTQSILKEKRIYAEGGERYAGAYPMVHASYYTDAIQNCKSQADKSEWNVEPENAPLMVSFKDLDNPKSVIEVDPTDMLNVFGTGVTLISIHVERTKDSVTSGKIEKILPWLNNRKYKYSSIFGESIAKPILVQQLQTTNFIWR